MEFTRDSLPAASALAKMSRSSRHTAWARARARIWLAAVILGVAAGCLRAAASAQDDSPHLLNAAPGVAYVGDDACRACHADIFDSFKRTGMGRSISVPSEALEEFRKPATFPGEIPGRSYSSFTRGGKFFHRELQVDSSGKVVFSDAREVAFAVGSGEHGRSYIVAKGDFLFMSPLSFYSKPGKWDLTPGYKEGLYHGFTRPAADLCVYCHVGLPQPVRGTVNRYERPPFRILAIGCERCHGPGAQHVQQRTKGQPLPSTYDPSIVNPARLPFGLRDNVCEQCHLAGDARVLRPGKSYLDFLPGAVLDDVVAIFAVPVQLKGGASEAISHAAQLRMSRCWTATKGKLGCITCHDPHAEPRGAEAAQQFRSKCLGCHTPQSCRLDSKLRLATSPPDNCIDCHMPRRSLATIAHSALTDHRILRRPAEGAETTQADSSPAVLDLVHETARPGQPDAIDLRTLALAYAQVAADFPVYAQRAREALERAAQELPEDAEVQSAFGLEIIAHSDSAESRRRAAQALERAIALHSTSVAVRERLAELKLRDGYVNAAITLLEEAVNLDPYDSPAHLALARDYLLVGERTRALESFERVLSFDPANSAARSEIERLRRSPTKDQILSRPKNRSTTKSGLFVAPK